MHFVQLSDSPTVQSVNCKVLPFADIEFLGENILVAGGWGLNPVVFKASGDPSAPEWAYVGMTDSAGEKKKGPEKKAKAMNMWKSKCSVPSFYSCNFMTGCSLHLMRISYNYIM